MEPDTTEEIKLCLNCPVIGECNETDPLCSYRKGRQVQQKYYEKLLKDPERLAREKVRWHKNYLGRKKAA